MSAFADFLNRRGGLARLRAALLLLWLPIVVAAIVPIAALCLITLIGLVVDTVAPLASAHAPETTLEGLLHLGTISVAITAAYLGLDDPEKVLANTRDARSEAIRNFRRSMKKLTIYCYVSISHRATICRYFILCLFMFSRWSPVHKLLEVAPRGWRPA